MATIRAEITGIKPLLRKLEKLSPEKTKAILIKSLDDCAKLVQINAATKQIMGGGAKAVVRGRGVQIKPHPTRLTSRRGGAGLVGHISIDRRPLPGAIDVGAELIYGKIHELGLGRYPKRAFLKPAVEDEEARFPAIFMKHWRREAGV